MSWPDSVKTNAIVASRERNTTNNAIVTKAQPLGWNPHEVWLTRVKQPRDLAAQSSPSEPANTLRQDNAARD